MKLFNLSTKGNLSRLLMRMRYRKQLLDIKGIATATGERKIIVFNFHRIGDIDEQNPFHMLHTISEVQFYDMIWMMKQVGRIVSLEKVIQGDLKDQLNFVITFDDVSYSIMNVVPYLFRNAIPFTLCPCTRITSEGAGMRDKVYFIIKARTNRELREWLDQQADISPEIKASVINDSAGGAAASESTRTEFDFYKFSKVAGFSHRLLEEQVIDPLYQEIMGNRQPPSNSDRPYLGWKELKQLSANPLVTIANHSHCHYNPTGMTSEDFRADLIKAHNIIRDELAIETNIYSVPFGGISQKAAWNVTECLRDSNYRMALWVSDRSGANLDPGRLPHQIQHISRNHVKQCADFKKLYDYVRECSSHSLPSISSAIPVKNTSDSVTLVENVHESRIMAFDNIVRYGKDYTGDIAYYQYLFRSAYFEHDLPENICAIDGRRDPVAVIYMIPVKLCVDSVFVIGSQLAGFRKLPESNALAGGALMLAALRKAPVSIGYLPSPQTSRVYQGPGWHVVVSRRYWLNVERLGSSYAGEVAEYSKAIFPEDVETMLTKYNQRQAFGLARSGALYRQRLDANPYLTSGYAVIRSNAGINGLFAWIKSSRTLAVADFVCTDANSFNLLLDYALRVAHADKLHWVVIESSHEWISKIMVERKVYRAADIPVYYYLNAKSYGCRHALENMVSHWSSIDHHQTLIYSDVLLRSGMDTPDSMPT